MKVYIYTDKTNDKYEILEARFLSMGHEVELISTLDHLDPENEVIIATNVDQQYLIFKKHCPLGNIYNMLDDKIGFYDYLKKNVDLLDGIKLIPHYDFYYRGPNVTKDFLVKERYGYSSAFNQIIHGSAYEMIKNHSQKSQVQDILEIKHIYGVSVSCLQGKILGAYSYLTNEGIDHVSYDTGFTAKRNNYIENTRVRNFMRKIVHRLKYNGIMEMEFLIDNKDVLHIMECNARISGSLRVPHYLDWVIMPYVIGIHYKTYAEWDLNDQTKWIDI